MPSLRETLRDELAFARVNLGMSHEEFMRQTPVEWAAVVRAWRAREDRENHRVARVCMVLAWCHGDTEAKETDFVPQLPTGEQQDEDEMIETLDEILSNHG